MAASCSARLSLAALLPPPPPLKRSASNAQLCIFIPSPPTILFSPPKHPRRPSFLVRSMFTNGSTDQVVPRSVPVRLANELLQAGHRYLDIRTVDEFSAGHPVGAVNIPYMLKLGSGLMKNPKFLEEVLSHFGKDDEIIIGCQSGRRSLMAATDLSSAGFTGITDIAGGYSAWIQNGLPIKQ